MGKFLNMKVKIGKNVLGVVDAFKGGDLPLLELEDGSEWHIAEDSVEAGEAAKERWADMAEQDPKEFTEMVGSDTLISWALGKNAGPGSIKVASLEEWLEVIADHPDEEFASYDGVEVKGEIDRELAEDLGWPDEDDWGSSWIDAVFYCVNRPHTKDDEDDEDDDEEDDEEGENKDED